ncbi:MAG TPA: acyltransferase family protein [Mycobacteriales bacterium]
MSGRAPKARTHRYVPALDGVRALAVVGVLLFHGGVPELRGGFLGVDAFFVLSGYLITALLLEERGRTGRIALLAFWGRRARRLLPALLVLVVVVAAVGRAVLGADELRALRGDALAALLYVANWRMVSGGSDYFARTAAPSLLQHTWSLGIEEQFYLLWPLLLMLLFRGRRPLNALLVVCAGGAFVSAVLAATQRDVGRAYYGTDTRAASLLVGALLATVLARRAAHARVPRRALGAAALAGTAYTAWAWTHAVGGAPWLFRGGLLLAAVSVAAVLADVALVPAGIAARVLSVPPLPLIGRVSYGLYLWHWPVFGVLTSSRFGLTGTALLAGRLVVTVVAAAASFVLVEQPVRRGRIGSSPLLRGRPAPLATGAAVVVAGALTVACTVPPRQPAVDAAGPVRIHVPAHARTGRGPPAPHHRPPRASVFGDSVAWTFVRYLPAHPGLEVRDRTVLGCGVVRGGPYRYFGAVHDQNHRCDDWAGSWARAVAADDPDVAVLFVGRWETMDRVHAGRWTRLGEPAYDAYLSAELDRAVATLSSRGARVVVCTYPYTRRGERPDGGLYPEDDPARVRRWNELLREVVGRHPGVAELADAGAVLDPGGRYTPTVDGVLVRSDGLHLTPAGSALLARWLLPRVAVAAR